MTEVTSDPLVRMADMRKLRWCSRGVRAWWHENGLDYGDFLTNGIPLSKLEAIGDAFTTQLSEVIRGRR